MSARCCLSLCTGCACRRSTLSNLGLQYCPSFIPTLTKHPPPLPLAVFRHPHSHCLFPSFPPNLSPPHPHPLQGPRHAQATSRPCGRRVQALSCAALGGPAGAAGAGGARGQRRGQDCGAGARGAAAGADGLEQVGEGAEVCAGGDAQGGCGKADIRGRGCLCGSCPVGCFIFRGPAIVPLSAWL